MVSLQKFIFLFIVVFASFLGAESKYDAFTEQQLKYIYSINDSNLTQDEMQDILQKQKRSYGNSLETIMSNKKSYISKTNIYDNEIFALEKIININKRAGNTYAVLRDEVQVKSYKLLTNQNMMIRDILASLDYSDSVTFSKDLNRYVAKNQLENEKLIDVDYKATLEIESTSQIMKQAQENIREFYALLDMNVDMINYMYLFENKMYRLNKYSRYHLIGAVIYIKNTKISNFLDPILEPYRLDVVKLFIIAVLIVLIYILRKFVYTALEKSIIKIESLQKYTKDILEVLRKPINILIIIININMILYVYNDFISVDKMAKTFNILYALMFTLMVYKVLNTVASIKIAEIDSTNKKVKNEVINVGIKIINFIILIIGLLFVLYFSGVNLTAVLSGLGIGGFAVALAAKDSLANFFGTLSILFSDTFSQGDWIVVEGAEGVVIEIGLRVTTLRTFDNALVAIPNATLANKDVKNWNKRTLGRRIKMTLGVKYDSKPQNIKKAVDEIRIMLEKHPDIASEHTKFDYAKRKSSKLVSKEDSLGIKKTLFVHLDSFSDSSINILVYCFSKSTNWGTWLEVKEDIMHKMMDILSENSLEFAFPSLSIYNEIQEN